MKCIPLNKKRETMSDFARSHNAYLIKHGQVQSTPVDVQLLQFETET